VPPVAVAIADSNVIAREFAERALNWIGAAAFAGHCQCEAAVIRSDDACKHIHGSCALGLRSKGDGESELVK